MADNIFDNLDLDLPRILVEFSAGVFFFLIVCKVFNTGL